MNDKAATLARRAVALLVDAVPVFAVVVMILGVTGGLTGPGIPSGLFGSWVWFPAWVLARVAYHTPFEGLFGWTPGKLVAGLRVRGELGGVPGLKAAFVRSSWRAVDGLVGNLVGAATAGIRADGKRLGDYFAGTNVETVALPWAQAHAPQMEPAGPPAGPQYSPEDAPSRRPGAQQAEAGAGPRKARRPKEKRQLTPDLRERLRNMEKIMAEKIVGQEEAVRELSAAMRRRLAGRFEPGRPASFLFMGPSGVGKTEVANTLAEEMYGGRQAMIRLDMSEYMDKHTAQRLTGAPPGYVGYEEGGQLTERMLEDPERVVLLDEIEKAHPDVWNILLQVLDAGRLTDGRGATVDFGEATVILTSNLLAEEIMRAQQAGEEIDVRKVKEALVGAGVKREIVNRLGRIIVFEGLSEADVREISRRMLGKTIESMRHQHGIELSITGEAIARIAQLGYEPENGSRPLRGVIEREVEDLLAELLLDEEIGRGERVVIWYDEEEGEFFWYDPDRLDASGSRPAGEA